MPAFNFKKQFASAVENGQKKQTIRAKRKDGRNPHVGDKLYLYVGMRTKSCRKLGKAICKEIHQITIDEFGINFDGRWLSIPEMKLFALADGFQYHTDLIVFFREVHGLPFEGLLYKW